MKTKFKIPFIFLSMILVLNLFSSPNSFAENDILWIKTYSGGIADYACDVATDPSRNIVIVGESWRNWPEKDDIYIIKYAPNGDIVWDKKYYSGEWLYEPKVAIDSTGNIIIASTAEWESGECFFILKYDSGGNYLWERRYYCNEAEVSGIATDDTGNIIVNGSCDNEGRDNCLTIKYDEIGNILWFKLYDSGEGWGEEGFGVATDKLGDVITTSHHSGYSVENDKHRTIKYDSYGNEKWIRIYSYNGGYPASYITGGVATDYNNNIIVIGGYQIIKYDPDGIIQWVQHTEGYSLVTKDVAEDIVGNIVVGNFSSSGYRDFFILKYAPDGNLLSTRRYDGGMNESLLGVAVDNEANIIATGYYEKYPDIASHFLTIKYHSQNYHINAMASKPTIKVGNTSQIVAIVTDYSDVPVSGVTVRFEVVAGGGSVSPVSTETDIWGRAYAILTTGATAGINTVQVLTNGGYATVDVLGLKTTQGRENLSGNNPVEGKPHDPISSYSGNIISTVQDLHIPGRIPIQFSRTYNSLSDYSGTLGPKWTYSYNIYLKNDANSDVLYYCGDGSIYRYVKNPDGSYKLPAGIFFTLTKNADSSYTQRGNDGTQYYYTVQGRLSRIADRNNNQVLFGYNANDLLTSITDSAGRLITLDYSDGKLYSLTDFAGRVTYYQYDDKGDLSYVFGSEYTAQYSYDKQHNLTVKNDPRSPKGYTNNSFVYDSFGRVVEGKDALERSQIKISYGTNPIRTTLTDANDKQTIHSYSNEGFLTDVTDAYNNNEPYVWDAFYLAKTRTTDANAHPTDYTYDPKGNCLSIKDAYNNLTSFEYEATFSNVIKIFDALERQIVNNEYDGNGNLLRTTDLLGNATSYTYDGYGQRLSMTDPRGKTTTFSYDQYGNLASVTDPLGNATQYAYDTLGRCTSKTDAYGKVTGYTWDDADRLTATSYPDGTSVSYTYDQNGNRTSITDANGYTTYYSYDSNDQLVSVTDPSGHTTSYEYDPNGNRTAMVDANGHRTEYTYDSLNRLTQTKDAENKTVNYTYDAVGNRASMTDGNGHITSYTYDEVNRLLSDGIVSYTYDKFGNRKTMTDAQGVTSYDYDDLNRLVKITYPQIVNGQPAVIEYGYDAAGNRTSMITPKGTTNYVYDDAGRLVSITQPSFGTVSYEYDKLGNRTKMTYPNGVYTTYEYNQNNYRLLSIKHYNKFSVLFDHYDYTYDNAGNRTSMTTNMGITSYTYDNLYQLTGVSTPKRGAQEYTYDPVGNRTYYKDKDAEIDDYSYNDANELGTANAVSYTYDNNGNLSTKGNFTYSWDFRNQLTEVKQSGTTIARFAYDGDGRRIRSTYDVRLTTINYLWDGMSEILETDNSGNITNEYLNGAGEILGKIRYLPSGIKQTFYFLHDGLGSTTYLLDNYGNIVNAYYYEPFGKCWNVTHDPGHNTRFTGKEYEEDFGLYFFFARWYDPEVGRFTTRDPVKEEIIEPLTINKYIYALNNPINQVDIYGLKPNYIEPVKGTITSKFGLRALKGITKFHEGIDVAANKGTPVKAAADGIVIESGLNDGYGNCVIIDHGNGYSTLYGHFDKILVEKGQKINSGDIIGKVGKTGVATGPHLHYEERYKDVPQSPTAYK